MRKDCTGYLNGLVKLAKGRDDAEARQHAESCPECASLLAFLSDVATRYAESAEPSLAATQRALDIMPKRTWTRATRMQNLGGLHLVRGPAASHALFEAGDSQISVGYLQTQDHVVVTGRIETELPVRIFVDAHEITLDAERRFSFSSASMSGSGFEALVGENWIEVPPGDGSDDAEPGP